MACKAGSMPRMIFGRRQGLYEISRVSFCPLFLMRNFFVGIEVKNNMTKNPFVNALAASAYIVVVAFTMFYASKAIDHMESVMVPIFVLSLFVLSAAVMGFLFCYQPLRLFLDGDKQEGVVFFLKTTAIFACTIFLIAFVWFFLNTSH